MQVTSPNIKVESLSEVNGIVGTLPMTTMTLLSSKRDCNSDGAICIASNSVREWGRHALSCPPLSHNALKDAIDGYVDLANIDAIAEGHSPSQGDGEIYRWNRSTSTLQTQVLPQRGNRIQPETEQTLTSECRDELKTYLVVGLAGTNFRRRSDGRRR